MSRGFRVWDLVRGLWGLLEVVSLGLRSVAISVSKHPLRHDVWFPRIWDDRPLNSMILAMGTPKPPILGTPVWISGLRVLSQGPRCRMKGVEDDCSKQTLPKV